MLHLCILVLQIFFANVLVNGHQLFLKRHILHYQRITSCFCSTCTIEEEFPEVIIFFGDEHHGRDRDRFRYCRHNETDGVVGTVECSHQSRIDYFYSHGSTIEISNNLVQYILNEDE